MELTELYKLRRSFSIIGLTGRTGSGCSKIAELLSGDFNKLSKDIRELSEINDELAQKKHSICLNYLSFEDNWYPYEILKYKDILLFYLISYYSQDYKALKNIIDTFYRESKKENNSKVATEVSKEITRTLSKSTLVSDIEDYKGDFSKIRTKSELEKLHNEFFGDEFKNLSSTIFKILEKNGYYRRTYLLHHLSCNIRKSGNPLNENEANDINYIYTIAQLTNRLIKSRKHQNDIDGKPTKIVIDSLRNSLEIMFFKERYSGFYMLATKDGNNRIKERIKERIEKKSLKEDASVLIKNVLDLDATEYKTSDHSKGVFSSTIRY